MNDGATTKFYGKYRGVVTDNSDPEQMGRIRAKVPNVLGDQPCTWALPASPYAGKKVGLFLIPPKDASVWIEFEQGDLQHPIWSGCFWGAADDVPESAGAAEVKVLKTDAGTIILNDQQGSEKITIELKTSSVDLKIVVDTQKIEISNGNEKIEVSSSSVKINDDALEVM
jgi:uncharacterized protein involved in type VI secretion and phage assembly